MYSMREYWVLLMLVLVEGRTSVEFDQFKHQMEDKVKSLAHELESIYERRCTDDIVSCQAKSVHLCEGTTDKECFLDFPTPPSCLGGGAYLADSSTIMFPAHVNPYNLTEEEKQFVCVSALLEDKFKQLNNDRNQQFTKAYIGSVFGSHRSYPSSYPGVSGVGSCNEYDPRFRPWYTTGSSGAKNVILIMDMSGSMQGSSLNTAKETAISVINSFSNSDFVGVVVFSDTVRTLYSDKLTRATWEFKEKVIEEIEGIGVHGGTNYEIAFRKAFDMIASADEDEYGAPCKKAQNVFLFLTDGSPKKGAQTATQLITIIDSLNQAFNIKLFTYALGSNADIEILRALSCRYFGIMFEVEDSVDRSEVITQMRSYYTYLAEGVTIEQPVWTQPYEDAFGFGRMVTVSFPVYYTENQVRRILGVAGIDVVMNTFYDFGLQEDQILTKLIMSAPCQVCSLTPCEIENLRPNNSLCGISNCSSQQQMLTCEGINATIYKQAANTDDNMCCGLSLAGFIVIMAIVGLIMVGAIALGCYFSRKTDGQLRRSRKKQKPVEQKYSSRNLNPAGQKNPSNPDFIPYFNREVIQKH